MSRKRYQVSLSDKYQIDQQVIEFLEHHPRGKRQEVLRQLVIAGYAVTVRHQSDRDALRQAIDPEDFHRMFELFTSFTEKSAELFAVSRAKQVDASRVPERAQISQAGAPDAEDASYSELPGASLTHRYGKTKGQILEDLPMPEISAQQNLNEIELIDCDPKIYAIDTDSEEQPCEQEGAEDEPEDPLAMLLRKM